MPRYDAETEAAIRHLLKGEGKSRSGTFMVTVHGGRIVAIAPIGGRLSSKDLHEQQQEQPHGEARSTEPRGAGDREAVPSRHPSTAATRSDHQKIPAAAHEAPRATALPGAMIEAAG